MTFVLVPGAGGDGFYWHLVAPLLGADTVSVTLPAGDESAGLAAYADAIVAAAGDATDITLVAQSMGGFSAPLVVDRLDVTRLVLLNAMVPKPGETFNEWWEAVGVPEQEEEWDDRRIFFHDVPRRGDRRGLRPRRARAVRRAVRRGLAAGRLAGRRDVRRDRPRRPAVPGVAAAPVPRRAARASSRPSSTAATCARCPTRRGWPRLCWGDAEAHRPEPGLASEPWLTYSSSTTSRASPPA